MVYLPFCWRRLAQRLVGLPLLLLVIGWDSDVANHEARNLARAHALLEAIQTGNQSALRFVSEDYVQHNLSVPDGKAPLYQIITGIPVGITVDIARSFADGDIVVLHSVYDGSWNHGFAQVIIDVFRFNSQGLIIEHWDNITDLAEDGDGTSQTDGASTPPTDIALTGYNRHIVTELVHELFLGGNWTNVRRYFDLENYVQHSVDSGADGSFLMELEGMTDMPFYTSTEFIYASGNFALVMSEGPDITGEDTQNTYAYFDIFRLEAGLVVEHWDVIQVIPPQSEWRNSNGKW
ncbi:nuclear transport factor 2 family protein [Vibrio sp. WXL210]|uniref:nuclear transport factor 2 family protein n=1 Tax=Vibrio sp. WXL210 TaxID=3450709 RepID=UPI003EC90CDA